VEAALKRDGLIVVESGSEPETERIASAVAGGLRGGDTVALVGSLGAGKTCFVKGLARGLGLADAGEVTSPTFVLVNEYETEPVLYHFDAYRLRGAEDLHFLGFDDYLDGGGICVIEWADHVRNCLPGVYLAVIIEHVTEGARRLRIGWHGDAGRQRQSELARRLAPLKGPSA
jgi:tRNA threonylcarbamoyladenosine biosynthesis protein TsaE